ncbi:MAG: hypothetical protein ACKVOE_03815 [Rickettsiales bacterium]
MTKLSRLNDARAQFDALTAAHFPLFLRRVVATSAPGASYLHNWHIEAISEYLKACETGQVRRLIINLPPRMLKSTLVSVAWPAWLLGQEPQRRIMAASYAQSLAEKHSTDCRVVLRADWYARVFAGMQLSDDQDTKTKFTTTARGYRLAVSVGGAAIGEGGDFLIVDDPISPLQARKRVAREAANAWFDHTFATRLDDKQRGVMVVVMQRLHPEDLSGYLLAKGGWEHLCLPAIAPERTVIRVGAWAHGREAGTALHPAREPLALLEKTQAEMGSHNFAAQYQQAPVKAGGPVIRPEWFSRFALKELLTEV